MRAKMLVSVPFTGLGIWNGYRGSRWLRNRIRVFETFVIPSLLNQTDRDFTLWVAWRREEKSNVQVQELLKRLEALPNFRVVFTYTGCALFDDKYDNETARERLFYTLKECLGDLMDVTSDCEEVHMLIQPSDDLYDKFTIESVKKAFRDTDAEAIAFTKGYICNYTTLETLEYNPNTIPPFAAIRFPRSTFFDPGKFLNYIGLKETVGKYPKGTPYPSHEYLSQCLKTAFFEGRGFMVGCHGENISTNFNHPFAGAKVEGILDNFGIGGVEPITIPISYRKWLMRKLPHRWQRKLRYIFGEILYTKIYSFLRN